jgi:hypothetical protein
VAALGAVPARVMAMGLAWCPAPPLARPRSHRVPEAPLVVLVFSFRLPQPSLGRVAFSISAFGVSQHGRERRGAVHVLSQCCGITSIYRRAHFPSRNRIDSNGFWQKSFELVWMPRTRRLARVLLTFPIDSIRRGLSPLGDTGMRPFFLHIPGFLVFAFSLLRRSGVCTLFMGQRPKSWR